MTLHDKRILVTGASGFIGSNLVSKLVSLNEVYSLVRNQSSANKQSKTIVADLTGDDLQIKESFDAVFHLASLTPLEKNKKILEKVNYFGTKKLFGALKERTKAFVYVSGIAVLDPTNVSINEHTPVRVDTEFVKIRVNTQKFLEENCKDYGIKFCTAYLADIVYGNGGFFQAMIIDRLKKGTFLIPGDGKYFKNFVHVDDATNALIAILGHDIQNPSYIISDSNPVPFREFLNYLSDKLGVSHPKSIPAALARIALGKDTISLLTRSTKAQNEKIRQIYEFQFPLYKQGLDAMFPNTVSSSIEAE